VLAGATLWSAPLVARAGSFQVSPVLVSVATFGDVAVTNTTSVTMRFSVSGFGWTQTPSEKHKIAPSDKLVYFPQVFTLAPGATQRVRVGMSDRTGPVEHAFRLYIAELPPFNPLQLKGQALTLLSRVDIPVFQPPTDPAVAVPGIERATEHDGNLGVLLANDGNVHTMPSQVGVTGRDADGKAVWSGSTDVWYVLAKSSQLATMPIAASACKRVRSFDITWRAEDRTVARTLANGTCT